ncbi:MAG: alpha-L-glutamate ligase-like protein [Saprospiraceae bacterium]|nr:alpha-L-glutamate ligase-like protein [Saprospiraceae bacterium]
MIKQILRGLQIPRYRHDQHSVLGINERNQKYVYALNDRKAFPLADDKIICKTVLDQHGIACAKTYATIERIGDIPKVWSQLQEYQKLAVKPAKGSGGGGIMILRKNAAGQWTQGGKPITTDHLFTQLARLLMGMYSFGTSDRVLIEQCIEPHPFFHEIYPAGVPDFRVILLKQAPVMAMLRLPTDRSDGKANLHQGGLGIGVNMEKGTLGMAFDGKDFHSVHPDNQHTILGKKIPYWNTLLDLSVATAKAFPALGYLGVDIVLDQHLGPLIMEINVRPGLGIQMANQQGLQSFLCK